MHNVCGKGMNKLGVNAGESTVDERKLHTTVQTAAVLPTRLHNFLVLLLAGIVQNFTELLSQKTGLSPLSTTTTMTTTTYLLNIKKIIGGVKNEA